MSVEIASTVQLAYAQDTFYFLVMGAFVMWMAAGFAMLEAGLVRAKNTTEILTKNIALFAIACIMYMFVGYGIMYSGDLPENYGIMDLMFNGSAGVMNGAENTVEVKDGVASPSNYYSNLADFFFQVVFVATAMSIVSGAVAERMKLWSFLAFAVIMTAIIYPVQGFWNWGGGFLTGNSPETGEALVGYVDYAGSGTVHLCGAIAAIVGISLLGARKGKYGSNGQVNAIPGANLPMATLGTFILWMGWFGFNGGSELAVSSFDSANNVAKVFVNTNMAAACGCIVALLVARTLFGKADLTMALNGALAGLVSITAQPLTPSPVLACIIGAVGGVLVVFSILALDKMKLDDPVGAVSVHGTAGIWGVLAVALSATKEKLNEAGEKVLDASGNVVMESNFGEQIVAQLIGLAAIIAWTAIASFLAWMLIKAVFGLRVSEEEEYNGVDISECGQEAYPEFTKG